MADDHTDLVHVRSDHDLPGIAPGSRRVLADDQVAQRIHAHFIRKGFQLATHNLANFIFITGGPKCFGEGLEKFFHKSSFFEQ